MGMAYTVHGERCRDGLCYLVAYESEESPVFEKVNDSNHRQQNLHLLVACSRANPSGWQQAALLVRLVTPV